VAVAILFLLSTVIIYNYLIIKKNDVENAFASIDVMLRRRYDLIPKIVEAVKAYMTCELERLTEITALSMRAIFQDLSGEERVMVENKTGK
jgi:LemA protein